MTIDRHTLARFINDSTTRFSMLKPGDLIRVTADYNGRHEWIHVVLAVGSANNRIEAVCECIHTTYPNTTYPIFGRGKFVMSEKSISFFQWEIFVTIDEFNALVPGDVINLSEDQTVFYVVLDGLHFIQGWPLGHVTVLLAVSLKLEIPNYQFELYANWAFKFEKCVRDIGLSIT